MIRRKLFAYTIVFIAGISAGFFIFEKARIAAGTLLMAALAVVICCAGNTDLSFCRAYSRSGVSGALHRLRLTADDLLSQSKEMKMRLIAALVLGFAVFTLRFIWYGTGFVYTGQNAGPAALAEENSRNNAESSAVAEESSRNNADEPDTFRQGSIEGLAESVTVKGGKMKIVMCDTDCLRRGMRVMVTMRVNENTEGQAYEYGNDEIDPYDPASLIGRRIIAYGTLREPSGADNPGCFDYRVYLRSRRIGFQLSAKSVYPAAQESTGTESAGTGSGGTGSGGAESADNGLSDKAASDNKLNSLTEELYVLYGKYIRTLYMARERFLDLFDDDECRAFIKGAVFGDKSDISDEVMEDFNGNGTGHILAVSGLHTGFLYALMRVLTRRRRNPGTAVLIIAVLVMYGDMTMWSPSTMRAVTVLSVSILSSYVRRPFDLLSAVSAAAMLILVREPYQLFSTGFQMSFMALLGIAFLSKPLSHFIGEAFAVMIAVQAGIVPVTACYFHRINVLSVFINIPVIFIASLLVPLCMTALLLSAISGLLSGAISGLSGGVAALYAARILDVISGFIVLISEGLTGIIVRLNDLMSAGGIFSELVTSPGAGFIIWFYLTVFMLASEWCRVKLLRHGYIMIALAMVCITTVSGCFGLAAYNSFADDEIVFVSVGQGDCTHIRAGGKDVLIDGGGSAERNIGEDILMPYLLSNGAERVEFALVTHLHTDHFLGISELADAYPVGAVGIPSDYRKSAEEMQGPVSPDQKSPDRFANENGIPLPDNILFIEHGSRIDIDDDVYVRPIWPLPGSGGDIRMDDPNEHNMVYMINYRGVKIMVTGDLLEEDELKMVSYYSGTDTLRCDVLKVAHHGSKSSSCEAFLDAASPGIAVIQVGLHNFYGHPHQQTLDRLAERGIKIYRTDLNGAVGIDIHSERISVDMFK